MLSDFSLIFNVWFPWYFIFSDVCIIQILILYCLYNMFVAHNLYYTIMYIIVQIILFGLFLSLYNLEMFTAFLWLTEVVIILVCFFLLFNTVPSGNINKVILNVYSYKNLPILFLSFLVSFNFTYWILPETCINTNFMETFLYEDYYEALANQNTNDLYGFYVSFL